MKFPRLGFNRRTLAAILVVLVAGYGIAILVIPELLIWSATLLIAEVEPFSADAIIVLSSPGPSSAWEAAELFRSGLASRIVITTEEPDGPSGELLKMGVDLVETHENSVRVLRGLGVTSDAVVIIEDTHQDLIDELMQVREFSRVQQWSRLIVVTSNYNSRRALLTTAYIFDDDWKISVVGSRYSDFRVNDWWHSSRQIRTFATEFQMLLAYELYLRPRLLF